MRDIHLAAVPEDVVHLVDIDGVPVIVDDVEHEQLCPSLILLSLAQNQRYDEFGFFRFWIKCQVRLALFQVKEHLFEEEGRSVLMTPLFPCPVQNLRDELVVEQMTEGSVSQVMTKSGDCDAQYVNLVNLQISLVLLEVLHYSLGQMGSSNTVLKPLVRCSWKHERTGAKLRKLSEALKLRGIN